MITEKLAALFCLLVPFIGMVLYVRGVGHRPDFIDYFVGYITGWIAAIVLAGCLLISVFCIQVLTS